MWIANTLVFPDQIEPSRQSRYVPLTIGNAPQQLRTPEGTTLIHEKPAEFPTFWRRVPIHVAFGDITVYRYTVRCSFTKPDSPEAAWLSWLRDKHLQDVVDAGAIAAEIVRMEDETPTYEVRYLFDSRESYNEYQTHHAPRLREEGLEKFPLELGLSYSRSSGEIVHTHVPAS